MLITSADRRCARQGLGTTVKSGPPSAHGFRSCRPIGRTAVSKTANHGSNPCGSSNFQAGRQMVSQRTLTPWIEGSTPSPSARVQRKETMFDTIRRIDSSDEHVSKYVFEKDDAVAEAVLYRYPTYEERTVICCSTQSGCPVGCRFCGAGDAFIRSLTADEIIAQVDHLFSDRNINVPAIKRLQIMFMSMGEPLLNWREMEQALPVLHAKYPNAALLISTIGPAIDYEPVMRMSAAIPAIGLQFSVHEVDDVSRTNLIPFRGKVSLSEISTIGQEWQRRTGRKPFFNYCAHPGNSSTREADAIRALFQPDVFEATVSVVCERDEHVSAANSRQRQLALDFMALLRERGFSVRCFDPAGQDDIGGGCGQLWFVQDFMRRNQAMARPSIGASLPIVHAPRMGV